MKNRRLLIAPALCLLAAGTAVQFGGEWVHVIALPAAAAAAALWIVASYRMDKRSRLASAPQSASVNVLAGHAEREADCAAGSEGIEVLGAQFTRREWDATDAIVDEIVGTCINLLYDRLGAHTIAVFFPTDNGGYKIRRFRSKSDCINSEAVIYPGIGVIGSFLKNGMRQLNLQDIVTDSMTLYYYTKDARIRSLMAHPIVAGGAGRGTIIADSTEEHYFTDEHHAQLGAVASLCGHAVYYAYSYNEYKLRYLRLSAMSNTEKYFFEKQEIDSVLDKMAEIIPFAIPCQRMTISLASAEGHTAVIRRAWGMQAGEFVNYPFSLTDKTLMGLLYAKNMCFFRNFSPGHYEPRYAAGEPQTPGIMSFLAMPVGVDRCRGAILLESAAKDAFTSSHRALLSRLVTSAAVAIEKIQVLEHARSLATHDGLTGLNNHRQFQKLLRDEITRATRYNDPLALVICDIDFFKKINDTHGHPFGDVVLKGIAATLQESVRDGIDIVARYGGEEFALVLAKSDAATAAETVERIRQSAGARLFRGPHGEDISVTLSFGMALWGVHAKQIDQLIQKADKALYRAKNNGRNRVEIF